VIAAVESPVLLDVLADNSARADRSAQAIRQASWQGQVIVCECVLAEIFLALGDADQVHRFLADCQIEFVPSDEDSTMLAGEMSSVSSSVVANGKRSSPISSSARMQRFMPTGLSPGIGGTSGIISPD
jgi:hypothetical protein